MKSEAKSPEGRVARYWSSKPDGSLVCRLCPKGCVLRPGQTGLCRVRTNVGGTLYADAYGKITSIALDPIEKKPLSRFFPGRFILSVGSYGCNFRCAFCQNWAISQQESPWRQIEPEDLAALARQEQSRGNIGVAYTYNEPLVNIEYVLDCAREVRRSNLKNVLVTNGSINPEPLAELLPWIDALNIDLKAWDPRFYREICRGELNPVLETIRTAAAVCHVELTTLLIPGKNDSEEDILAMAAWIAERDPEIVWHLSRHHPDYLMTTPPPIRPERMQALAELARRHLKYVVLGNV